MAKFKNRESNFNLNISFFVLFLLLTCVYANWAQAQTLDQTTDSDNDGLTDYQEQNIYHTDWQNPDTDADGFNDGEEISKDYSPTKPKLKLVDVDTDKDGLNDDWEIKLGADLTNPDSDGDGYKDGEEVAKSYSPTNTKPIKVEKRIEVNIKNFSLKYFFNNIELGSTSISTGKPSTPTPKGTFTIMDKVPVKNYTNLPNTKWNLHFTTGKNKLRYYIHGAYWHNLFGIKNVSGGCVNVPYSDMEKLYNWTQVGTKVLIN